MGAGQSHAQLHRSSSTLNCMRLPQKGNDISEEEAKAKMS